MTRSILTFMFKKLEGVSTGRLCTGLALIYILVAYACLQLAFKGTNASPVWPPSGIAFVAVWFLGHRVWPGIWAGAFFSNLLDFIHQGWLPGQALGVSAVIGVGNSLEALACTFLLHSFTDEMYLSKIRDIFKFVFSAMVACSFSAIIGTSTVYVVHPAANISFDMVWFTWWLGDMVGIFVIASIFLTYHKELWQFSSWKNILEAIMVTLVLVAVNTGVFMGTFPEYGFYSHVTYLILPFAIWATYRFGFPGATVSILTTAVIAVIGSILHLGPFVGQRLPEQLAIVECFLGVIAVTVLSLGAALYERQKAEEGLKYNEARFRSLVENSFEVIALVDTRGKVIYTSPSSKNILGYDTTMFLGRPMFEWMHPEDIPLVKEKFLELLQTPGGIDHAVCRMQHKDGSWRWMEGSGRNLLNDPVVGAIVINYRDITERKFSQERFERLVEYSPIAKIMVNKEGKIQLVNKTTENLFGFSRQELLNMKIEELVPQQFRDKHPGYRDEFNHDPKPRPMGPERELYALKKDGKQVPVEIGLTPIETEEGFSVLASIVDISQRKKAEEILRRDKESLELLVDERSKELIKTQKELKHFSRLADIGTLAATVAHELRNPLGVIHLAAYNLRKEKAELNDNRHLSNIEKKVWEGNQIIDNLLSYARIKIPNYEEVKIISILDECASSAQGRFGEKGIVIEKKYEADVGFIEADPNQIREIFANILNNACQSFPTGSDGGKVELSAERAGEMIKISVKDTGVGIAAEDLDKIFEPFFTRKAKGTGLGLTICNELVNMHQGKIEIDSKEGQGTKVSIFLPEYRRKHAENSSN